MERSIERSDYLAKTATQTKITAELAQTFENILNRFSLVVSKIIRSHYEAYSNRSSA